MMTIHFDLRGVLSAPTSSVLRMAGMVRVNLEWAGQLKKNSHVSFVAPGLRKSVVTTLSSSSEWEWLSRRIDGHNEGPFDDFCCDFLAGRWKCSRVRHWLAPWLVKLKFPNDIAGFVKQISVSGMPSIYFVPSVKRMPKSFPQGMIPVMNVYDLIPLLFSEGQAVGDQDYTDAIETIRDQGGHFIVNSRYVRHSLISMFAIPADYVHVVPLGTNPVVDIPTFSRNLDFSLPYFLQISGDCQRRKNVEGTIQGFCRFLEITDANHQLRIVGPDHRQVESLIPNNAAKWRDRIIGMGHVNDQVLNRLLASASCGLYLSIHEGFGLPPLECMKYGVPMICSNVTSIPEIVGDAALLVDPFDNEEIALAMQRVVEDSELAKLLSDAGIKRAAKYSWARSGQIMMETLEKILEFSRLERKT